MNEFDRMLEDMLADINKEPEIKLVCKDCEGTGIIREEADLGAYVEYKCDCN